MKKTLSALLFLIFALAPHVAVAQQTALAIVVQSCGTAPYTYVKGQRQPVVQDVNGNVCTTAAVTASISGFQTTSYGTPISATTGGATGSIPTNAGEFVAQNVGTFGAFCKTGASVDTAGQYISPNGGWFAYAVTSETQITCEGVGGTTTVNLFGGTGLPTGTGGGGGGSGGAITAASGAFASGSIASGAMVDLGAQADSACSTDNGSCSLVALQKRGNQNLTTLNTTAGSSLAAGSALIGQVSLNIAAAANSATNGAYFNLLQGNAVIASGNPIFSQGTTSTAHIGNVDPNTAANWGLGATGAAAPANSVFVGATTGGATGGYMQGLVTCNSHTFVHITSATDTVLVQGTASQSIYSCGWRARAAGVATWYIEDEADANNNCSNLGSQLTGIATEAANTGEVAKSPFWDGFKGTSGHGFCIKSTGTGGVDIDFWYTKF